MFSLFVGSETFAEAADFMYEAEMLEASEPCHACFEHFTGDYWGGACGQGSGLEHCVFEGGPDTYIDSEITPSTNKLKQTGVLYVTYFDVPGKMITRMNFGNRACGFTEYSPPKGAGEYWQLGEFTLKIFGHGWEEAEAAPTDYILICYEDLPSS